MKRVDRHQIAYAATALAFPDYRPYSRYYWPMKNYLLSLLLNPCPTYAEGFFLLSHNTDIPESERMQLTWPLFCSYDPASEHPDNGKLRITEERLKQCLNDYHLHHKVTNSSGYVYPFLESKFVIICRCPGCWMVSKPIRLTDIVTWFKHPSNGYDSTVHVENFKTTGQDTRRVEAGHRYNVLELEGVNVYKEASGDLIFPFDMTSDGNRSKLKFTNGYIYPMKNVVKDEYMQSAIQNQAVRREIHVGVYGDPVKQVKRILPVKINADERKAYYKELYSLKAKYPSELITHMKSNHPNYILFPTYEWGTIPSLSKTFKELL